MSAERSTPRSIYLLAFEKRAEPGLNVCLISVSALHLQRKVDKCCKRRSHNGWNTISCASRMQSAVRGTLSSCATIPHLPRIESINLTISRSLKDLGCLSHTYIGMCSGAKVCRSIASLPTVITRQTFGFSWPTAAQLTHISATCEFCERATDSSIGMEGLVFLEYVASIVGQVPTSRIGGLHMHTTEPVGIIASCSRRSRRG